MDTCTIEPEPQYKILYDIERELRELSTKLQEKPYDDRLKTFAANRTSMLIRKAIDDLENDIELLRNTKLTELEMFSLAKEANIASSTLEDIQKQLSFINDDIKYDIESDFVSNTTDGLLGELDSAVSTFTGSKCRFGVKNAAGIVNDLASCIHRVADTLQEILDSIKVSDKCYKTNDVDDDILIEACKEWDKATKELHESGYYQMNDYKKLQGKIIPNRLMLVVGSSINHQTHFDLEQNTVRYYDSDEDVNFVMSDLWHTIGLKCIVMNDGVKCEGLNKDNLINAVKAAAAATSMDIRIKDLYDSTEYLIDNKEYKELLNKKVALIEEYNNLGKKRQADVDALVKLVEDEILIPDKEYVLDRLKDIKVI